MYWSTIQVEVWQAARIPPLSENYVIQTADIIEECPSVNEFRPFELGNCN